jgi:hypothetical protein
MNIYINIYISLKMTGFGVLSSDKVPVSYVRNSLNQPDTDDPPPTSPHHLLKLGGLQFSESVGSQKHRLKTKFTIV